MVNLNSTPKLDPFAIITSSRCLTTSIQISTVCSNASQTCTYRKSSKNAWISQT